MTEFSAFERHGESVLDCAASLYCVNDQVWDELKDDMGELDFDRRGMVATLRMLVSRLELISVEIGDFVEFKEISALAQQGESVLDCATSLYCVTNQVWDELKDDMGELDFDRRGMVATLRMLVSRLELISAEIRDSVKFHESRAEEVATGKLKSLAAVNK